LAVVLFYPKLSKVPCANTISCKESFNFKVENSSTAVFNGQKLTPPTISESMLALLPDVLGDSTATGEKRIYVDLTNQKLYAYQGNTLFMEAYVSTGKWFPTPPGDYDIWVKIRSTRMSGGSGDDYYNLPNVPYVMFFSNKDIPRSAGFSLHGAYWHNNFGHAMSHGCINLRISDAEKLYAWATPEVKSHTTYADNKNPGTKVTVFGEAP